MGDTAQGFALDETVVERFSSLLGDEGIMRAGFHAVSEADNENSEEDGPAGA